MKTQRLGKSLTVQNVAEARSNGLLFSFTHGIGSNHPRSSGESERAEQSRWSYWRFRIFLAAWALYAAYYFCRKNFSVVMPMMARTSHYNNFDLAHAVFVFSLAYATGQFISGASATASAADLPGSLADSCQPPVPVAMAMAPSYRPFCCCRSATDWAKDADGPSCLSHGGWFARKKRGAVMAWWGTSTFWADSWRPSSPPSRLLRCFLQSDGGARIPVSRLFLGLAAIWFGLRTRNTPEEARYPGSSTPNGRPEEAGSPWQAARTPEVWILSGMYFFLKITRYSLLFWLPLYLVQRNKCASRAGYTSSLFEFVGFSGRSSRDMFPTALNGSRYPVGATMLFLLAGALLMHPVIGRLGPVAMACSISLLGILIYGPDLLMSGPASVDAVGLRHAARAAGIVNGDRLAWATHFGVCGGDDCEPVRMRTNFYVFPAVRFGGGRVIDLAVE